MRRSPDRDASPWPRPRPQRPPQRRRSSPAVNHRRSLRTPQTYLGLRWKRASENQKVKGGPLSRTPGGPLCSQSPKPLGQEPSPQELRLLFRPRMSRPAPRRPPPPLQTSLKFPPSRTWTTSLARKSRRPLLARRRVTRGSASVQNRPRNRRLPSRALLLGPKPPPRPCLRRHLLHKSPPRLSPCPLPQKKSRRPRSQPPPLPRRSPPHCPPPRLLLRPQRRGISPPLQRSSSLLPLLLLPLL